MKESKAPSLGRTPAQKFFDKWQGLFYLIPWIIGFVVFKAIPFGQSLYYSFTDMDFFNGIHQYGIMNYVDAFTTPKITKALITTFKYSFITVPLKLVFALFIAYILNFKIACVNVFRTVYLRRIRQSVNKFVLLQSGSIKRACNSKSHDNKDATDTHRRF